MQQFNIKPMKKIYVNSNMSIISHYMALPNSWLIHDNDFTVFKIGFK